MAQTVNAHTHFDQHCLVLAHDSDGEVRQCCMPAPHEGIVRNNLRHACNGLAITREGRIGMARDSKDKGGLNEQQLIRELAVLLDETGLSEIEIERSGLKVRVARSIQVVGQAALVPQSGAAAGLASSVDRSATPDAQAHPGAVKSPMVGTIYLAPEPGAPPFVDVGTTVTEGQTVLIIEAMKTMNHIPAPRSGVVKQLLVADGHPVEFGEPLLIIE